MHDVSVGPVVSTIKLPKMAINESRYHQNKADYLILLKCTTKSSHPNLLSGVCHSCISANSWQINSS